LAGFLRAADLVARRVFIDRADSRSGDFPRLADDDHDDSGLH
jgi:hypothetical protein